MIQSGNWRGIKPYVCLNTWLILNMHYYNNTVGIIIFYNNNSLKNI